MQSLTDDTDTRAKSKNCIEKIERHKPMNVVSFESVIERWYGPMANVIVDWE